MLRGPPGPGPVKGTGMGSASPQSRLGSTFKASLQCLGKKAWWGANDRPGVCLPPPTRVTPQPCTFLWHSEKGH